MLLEKLGEGSFGKVFKARNEETRQLAAVKIVPVEQDTGEVTREIETLKTCTSPNIVQYFGSHTKDGELWIIMEFCAGSSLADVMEVSSSSFYSAILLSLSLAHIFSPRSLPIRAGARALPQRGADRRGDGGDARRLELPPRPLAAAHPPRRQGGQPAPQRGGRDQARRLWRLGPDWLDAIKARYGDRHALLDGSGGDLGRPAGRIQHESRRLVVGYYRD